MSKRKLEIIRSEFPVSGICEQCDEIFVSVNERLDAAEAHVRSQFDAHECKAKAQSVSSSGAQH